MCNRTVRLLAIVFFEVDAELLHEDLNAAALNMIVHQSE